MDDQKDKREKPELQLSAGEKLEKEIEQAKKEGKSEAWIRLNLDI